MELSLTEQLEIALLRRKALSILDEMAHWAAAERVSRMFQAFQQKFDPNQPRAPRGQPDGGQWTGGGGGGSSGSESFRRYLREGTAPRKPFDPYTDDPGIESVYPIEEAIGWAAGGFGAGSWIARQARQVLKDPGNAYRIAKEGGKHAVALTKYAERTTRQVSKAARSHKQQVEIHLRKLADPTTGAERWNNLNRKEKSGLIRKWKKDANRHNELSEIMKGILKERNKSWYLTMADMKFA